MRNIDENTSDRPARLLKGVLAGLTGGLIASWVMNQIPKPPPSPAAKKGDDATQKTANAISKNVAGHTLTTKEKATAGPIVHYVFGSTMGALYGAAAEVWRPTQLGWGLPFGTALWVGADEIAVPALGLGGAPVDTPPAIHAYGLAVHLVYGMTTEVVRRAIRAAL